MSDKIINSPLSTRMDIDPSPGAGKMASKVIQKVYEDGGVGFAMSAMRVEGDVEVVIFAIRRVQQFPIDVAKDIRNQLDSVIADAEKAQAALAEKAKAKETAK